MPTVRFVIETHVYESAAKPDQLWSAAETLAKDVNYDGAPFKVVSVEVEKTYFASVEKPAEVSLDEAIARG